MPTVLGISLTQAIRGMCAMRVMRGMANDARGYLMHSCTPCTHHGIVNVVRSHLMHHAPHATMHGWPMSSGAIYVTPRTHAPFHRWSMSSSAISCMRGWPMSKVPPHAHMHPCVDSQCRQVPPHAPMHPCVDGQCHQVPPHAPMQLLGHQLHVACDAPTSDRTRKLSF